MNVLVFSGEKFSVSLTSMGTFNLPVSMKILHKMLLPTDKSIELRHAHRLKTVNNSFIDTRPLQVVYWFLVRVFPKLRGGRAGYLIMSLLT